MEKNNERIAEFLKRFGLLQENDTRLSAVSVLKQLLAHKGGYVTNEQLARELEGVVTASNVRRHVLKLQRAGLLMHDRHDNKQFCFPNDPELLYSIRRAVVASQLELDRYHIQALIA